MRITKQIAEDVSKEMLAKKTQKLEGIKDELAKELHQECLKLIPSDVLDMYPNYPEYFTTTRCCRFDVYSHDIGSYLPSSHGNNFSIEPTDKIRSLVKLKVATNKEIEQLKREIYNVVLSAKTLNNLKKIMPKAVDFIRVKGDLLLPSIDIENLMNRIDN